MHLRRLKTNIYAACGLWLLVTSLAPAQERRRWEDPVNLVAQNSPSDDFAPAWSKAEKVLYFSSTVGGTSQFYTARYEPPSGSAASPNDISFRFVGHDLVQSSLNTPRNNQSFIAFANDGSVYFSAFRQTKRRPYLNIFQAARTNSKTTNLKTANTGSHPSTLWERPEPAPILNTDDFNAHPTLSPSGRFIVFASERAGGRGGTDLWISMRDENGDWQQPVNMGDALNSPADEVSPYFAAEDSLYFASNGFGGKGGFEIFLVTRSGSKWQTPVPVTELNSEYDDYDFTMLPSLNGAMMCVFASNRAGGRGGIDLYASRLSSVALNVSSVEYKVATQTTFLTVEEVSTTDVLPMLPCLFFGDNASAIPNDVKQLSYEEAQQYSPTAARPDQLGVYAETLNVIGRRLTEYPEAALILTPFVPESPSARQVELAKARVTSIRNYLLRIWRIDPARLVNAAPRSIAEMLPNATPGTGSQSGKSAVPIRTTMLGSNERSRCVEFSCSDPRVLQPVKIGSVTALSKTQRLETYLDARPRDLVRSWTFLAMAAGDTLLTTEGEKFPYTVNIPLAPEMLNRVKNEIRLHVRGQDSLGREGKSEMRVTVYKIPLVTDTQGKPEKVVERHKILLLDESQDNLNNEQKLALRSLAATLTQGSTLTVSGYGSPDAKRSGAQIELFVNLIADELRSLVQSSQKVLVTADFLGDSDALLAASPQERLYARSVNVTVERPVKNGK
jgi:Tol biopolymer transport system component